MRILHIDTGRELRGGQRQVLLLARGLAERGHRQAILARRPGPLYAESLTRGFETVALGAAALAAEARRADLIHAHTAHAHTLAVLAACDRPLVVSRRVAFPVAAGALSRWKYQRATRFLAVSEFVQRQLLAAGIAAEKISVVHDGVEVSGPPEMGPRSRVVVAPATGDAQKGSALAAEACRAAGVEVKFSSLLERDLAGAALFLYLSYSEGLGSAILLAMARGTPVVASRVGGIPEVIEHERTGLLVENRIPGVAAAIHSVLDDSDSALRRAAAAYEDLLARFTDAIMVAQTEQAYQLAIRSRS